MRGTGGGREEAMDYQNIPQSFLSYYSKEIPDLWKCIDGEREERSITGVCPWDARCLLPDDAWHAFARNNFRAMTAEMASSLIDSLMAISAWRPTQDIILIDEAVLEALMNSEVDKLPLEILGHLPPWCIYVPIPDGCRESTGLDKAVVGVFFYYGVANTKGSHSGKSGFELRILPVLVGVASQAIPLPLSEELETVSQALNALWNPDAKPENPALEHMTKTFVSRMLSVFLYAITEMEKAYGNYGCELPSPRPTPTKTKNGFRLFPAKKIKEWKLGEKIGSQLRRAEASTNREMPSQDKGKRRPHIRRGHWQLYWTGRRKFKEGEVPVRQTPKLIWKPISLVAGYIEDDSLED